MRVAFSLDRFLLWERRRKKFPRSEPRKVNWRVVLQVSLAALFVLGWASATWGLVWATGCLWLWPIAGGVLLMGGAGLTVWALVVEEKQQKGRPR